MNPRSPHGGDDPQRWGRWDVIGHRTIYAAECAAGAYVETLQGFRYQPAGSPNLTDLFDEEPADGATLDDAVTTEWQRQFGGFGPGFMPQGWREGRSLYRLELPAAGWFIDIEQAATVNTTGRVLQAQLSALGIDQLTLAEIYGRNRRLTTTVAAWYRSLVLEDG